MELWSLASKCRESRGAHWPALPQSFISPIYTSLLNAHAVAVREWCTPAGEISILPWHPQLTKSSKTQQFEKQCSLVSCSRLNFCGSTSCCFFSVDGVQMERLQSGCEEKKCHRGLRICCWCMQLASMHYSMIECSEEDLPDSYWRVDCHHELSQLAVSLERCSLIRKGKAFI